MAILVSMKMIQPSIIYPNERINRIIRMVELKQAGRCFFAINVLQMITLL
jgi:hypothetical protein